MMKETVFITAFILGFNLAVGQLNWSCNDEVDGCWIYLKCTTNVNLNLSSLTCDLDGRRYHACMYVGSNSYFSDSFRFSM